MWLYTIIQDFIIVINNNGSFYLVVAFIKYNYTYYSIYQTSVFCPNIGDNTLKSLWKSGNNQWGFPHHFPTPN